MAAEWTRLHPDTSETCASVSCGHAPASWRMDAGGVGSWFCEPCRVKIMGSDLLHAGPAVIHLPCGGSEPTNGLTIIRAEQR